MQAWIIHQPKLTPTVYTKKLMKYNSVRFKYFRIQALSTLPYIIRHVIVTTAQISINARFLFTSVLKQLSP